LESEETKSDMSFFVIAFLPEVQQSKNTFPCEVIV